MRDQCIKTAVVTGYHPFHLPAFTRLFRALPGIDAYIQPLEDFVADHGNVRDWYDVVVFYNFHQETPDASGEEPGWRRGTRAALERLGETPQGIVVLHHGLLAYRGWQLWSDIVGIETRGVGFHPDQHVPVHVADPDHPITQGVRDFEIIDETYTINEPGPDSDLLLTTEHRNSMRSLAWTRTYKQARVFCYESGHGVPAYENPHFRTVLARGIAWAACVIE